MSTNSSLQWEMGVRYLSSCAKDKIATKVMAE
jgi:hypothetical protein